MGAGALWAGKTHLPLQGSAASLRRVCLSRGPACSRARGPSRSVVCIIAPLAQGTGTAGSAGAHHTPSQVTPCSQVLCCSGPSESWHYTEEVQMIKKRRAA